jgi:uncharacterized membrane protein
MMHVGMGFGLVLMVAFWVGLIVLGIWLVRLLFPHVSQPPAASSNASARDILDRRFAQGEISAQEYEMMKRAISDGTR